MGMHAVEENPVKNTAKPNQSKLIEEHLGLVHHVARQLYNSYAIQADFDELVSAGTMGLMGAVENFDPTRGMKFSTFAAPRIRGSILDELRRMDHVPRSLRRKTRELAGAREALIRVLGRNPEPQEMAEHLNIDLNTLWRWEAETERVSQVSLTDSGPDHNGRRLSPADMIAGQTHHEIEDRVNLTQETAVLTEALMQLKPQERTVLTLYYFEELKLYQIAAVLEVTESRVSQIRSKAIEKLRVQMSALRDEQRVA